MPRLAAALIPLALTLPAPPAHATQVCAWMVETNKPDDLHEVDLWLQSDGEVSFLYKMAGRGLVSEDSKAHSPGSGTFHLEPGVPKRPWGFGATLTPPADIDIVAELHAVPADIFSDAPTPLLASFTFSRHIPEGETKAPPTLMAKQCKTLEQPK